MHMQAHINMQAHMCTDMHIAMVPFCSAGLKKFYSLSSCNLAFLILRRVVFSKYTFSSHSSACTLKLYCHPQQT